MSKSAHASYNILPLLIFLHAFHMAYGHRPVTPGSIPAIALRLNLFQAKLMPLLCAS